MTAHGKAVCCAPTAMARADRSKRITTSDPDPDAYPHLTLTVTHAGLL